MAAEMERPLPQMPLNPASSTILALSPLCASMRKPSCPGVVISCFSCVVLRRGWADVDKLRPAAWRGERERGGTDKGGEPRKKKAQWADTVSEDDTSLPAVGPLASARSLCRPVAVSLLTLAGRHACDGCELHWSRGGGGGGGSDSKQLQPHRGTVGLVEARWASVRLRRCCEGVATAADSGQQHARSVSLSLFLSLCTYAP